MADIKDKLPTPPGEGDSKKGGVSHGVMSKSFGLQRKTLARVIGLEKRVDKIESGEGGIDADKFADLNRSILGINNNLVAIKDALDADLAGEQAKADDKKKDDARKLDKDKKSKAEKFLELDQEKKMVKPVTEKVENAKSVFQRLFDALTAIFGGWLLDKGGKMLAAWESGDMETFNKMKNEIIKALAIVGGIFAVANIGTIIAGMKLLIAGLKIGVPAILGLLANPWTWVVLGVGTGLYFGVKAIKRQVTGGGEFEDVDKHLRKEASKAGIKMHHTGNASVVNDAGNVMWVNTYGEDGIMGRESTHGQPGSKDQKADHRQRLTLEKESHREWIKKHMGEEKLNEMLAAKENYNKMMDLKNEIKKEMRLKMKLDRKAWYKQTKDLEKQLREDGKIGGKNWKKVSLLNWADTSAGQWWNTKDKEWKKIKADIRVEYVDKLKAQFPDAFKGQEIIPQEFEAINEDDMRSLAEQRYQDLNSEDYGSGGIKINNDETTIENNNDSSTAKGDGMEGTRTSVPLPNGILQPSKQASRNTNEQKLQSISQPTEGANNIEILPVAGGSPPPDSDLPLETGNASELPTLLTANSGNEYRFFYTHMYQQGTN